MGYVFAMAEDKEMQLVQRIYHPGELLHRSLNLEAVVKLVTPLSVLDSERHISFIKFGKLTLAITLKPSYMPTGWIQNFNRNKFSLQLSGTSVSSALTQCRGRLKLEEDLHTGQIPAT